MREISSESLDLAKQSCYALGLVREKWWEEIQVLISVVLYLLLEASTVQAVLIVTDTLCDLIGLSVMLLAEYVSYN